MVKSFRLARVALAAIVAFSWTVGDAIAQRRGDRRPQDRQEEVRKEETQAIVELVDQAMAGETTRSDVPLGWHNDFLKAQEGLTYVPFILTVEAAAIESPVVLYYRVVERGAEAPTDSGKAGGNAEDERPEYAFEDVHFIDLPRPSGGEPQRVARAFAVPGGEYDVYVALKESRQTDGKREAEEAKASVLRQRITVPDYWTEDLTTSSVIVAERVEPLTSPIPPEQQNERPYALGSTEIVPSLEHTFGQKDELSILFIIYNAALDGNAKPNVEVEYNFYQKTADGETYFNRTSPQVFNAETLPPQFDIAAGHQLVAGQSVGLAPFPEGDFRLEIQVTDKNSGQSITRDLIFTVAGT